MKKKYALTLIEMLVAILVFSIGILAVLRVIMGNISVMDYTNRKLQSTILAKEGIELLYNVRDSNLEKNLPWNCVMNPIIYASNTTSQDLTRLMSNSPDEVSAICSDYFGVGKFLQLSFDKNYYIIQKTVVSVDDFDQLFDKNRLCLYKDTTKNMSWYAYCGNEPGGEETFFARYLSFSEVKTSGILPKEKILKVESHVLFKKGGSTGDVVFESFIGNY